MLMSDVMPGQNIDDAARAIIPLVPGAQRGGLAGTVVLAIGG